MIKGFSKANIRNSSTKNVVLIEIGYQLISHISSNYISGLYYISIIFNGNRKCNLNAFLNRILCKLTDRYISRFAMKINYFPSVYDSLNGLE